MSQRPPITPCQLRPEARAAIVAYAEALKTAAPSIGDHGLSAQEFWDSGLFQGAIERLRGQQAASMAVKREFIRNILDFLQVCGYVSRWTASGSADRHDYEVVLPDQTVVAIEAKVAWTETTRISSCARRTPTSSTSGRCARIQAQTPAIMRGPAFTPA